MSFGHPGRNDRSYNALAIGLLAMLLILIFGVGITTPYVYHDDFYTWPFTFWTDSTCVSHPLFDHLKFVKARPLGAYFVCALAWHMKTIDSSQVLRTYGLISLWIFASGFYLFARRQIKSWWQAWFLTALVFSAIWAGILFGYIYNLTLLAAAMATFAAGAGLCWLNDRGSIRKRSDHALLLLFICLGFAGLLTYQTSAMWFWIPVLIVFLFKEANSWKERIRNIKNPSLWLIVLMAAYFAYARIKLYRTSRLGHELLQVNTHPLERVWWYFSEVVPRQGFSIVDFVTGRTLVSPWLLISVLFLAIIGGSLRRGGGWKTVLSNGFLVLCTCMGFLLLAYAPVLSSTADRSGTFFRSATVLNASGLIMVFWALRELLCFRAKQLVWQTFCLVSTLMILLGALAYTSRRAFMDGIVNPISQEQSFFAARLSALLAAGKRKVILVYADTGTIATNTHMVYDEMFTSMSYYPNDLFGATVASMVQIGHPYESYRYEGLKFFINGIEFERMPYDLWKAMTSHEGNDVNFVENLQNRSSDL